MPESNKPFEVVRAKMKEKRDIERGSGEDRPEQGLITILYDNYDETKAEYERLDAQQKAKFDEAIGDLADAFKQGKLMVELQLHTVENPNERFEGLNNLLDEIAFEPAIEIKEEVHIPYEEEEPAKPDHEKETTNSQQLCCGACLIGPSSTSMPPKITNFLMLLTVAMNAFSLVFLWPNWAWLTIINLILGALTLVLIWTVQCSDPGIQSRKQKVEQIDNNEEGVNVNDTQLSFNPYEKVAFDPEKYN